MNKINLYKSVLSTVLLSGVVFAEPEVTGKITAESAQFTSSGTSIGATSAHGKDNFKNQLSGRVYIDGALEDELGSTYHVELQGFHDTEAVNSHDSNEPYTQRDPLREAYIDTSYGDWLVRAGKQQVVWGTADGMKLLDSINPTDYSEMAQNQMEDSRIPIWMINAETNDEYGGNHQFIVSESQSSFFSGLGEESSGAKGSAALDGSSTPFTPHTNNSSGAAFITKGADTITGKKNGFLNVAPALGSVAQAFDRGALYLHSGTYYYVSLQGYNKASVDDFASNYNQAGNQSIGFKGFCDNTNTSAQCLTNIVNNAMAPNGANYGANNANAQNLMPATVSNNDWHNAVNGVGSAPSYVIAYMPDATFATFDAFVNMKSKYIVDHENEPVIGYRYKNTTDSGINYSLNFSYGNDTNPYVDMEWQDTSGNVLTETVTAAEATDVNGNVIYYTNSLRAAGDSSNSVGGKSILSSAELAAGGMGASSKAGTATDVAVLVMKEKLNKIKQIGGSMDMTLETDTFGPMVIRGEAVYQKDVMSPVITRKDPSGKDLNHGFLVSSLNMTKGDRFKYVLGADITALTNMMVSLQFIQDRNLDYVDDGSINNGIWKYTGDMATMHLTNNLNKAEENKEFYSLYLSKPFGESGQHRWNNIFIFEENNGRWNRFDVEYTIDDNTIGTVEYNKYWGNPDTQFGQFKDSSNIQVGLKYTF